MPLFVLNKELYFPPVHLSEPDGLLAMGGDLSPERLILAYRNGIFPWYEGDHILWWCPNPRFVLFPEELHVSKSMRTLLNQPGYACNCLRRILRRPAQCESVFQKTGSAEWHHSHERRL